MEASIFKNEPLLVVGNGRLSQSITVCLLQAGHPVTLVTENKENAIASIKKHLNDLDPSYLARRLQRLKTTDSLYSTLSFRLAIVLTEENEVQKKWMVTELTGKLPSDSVIAINTESIPLEALQGNCKLPERVFGANWVEPAHTTYFLELITNDQSNKELAGNLASHAKNFWNKDPYIISSGIGIRARLFSAMVREAFYLVSNGYASIDDIDRACRNDPGYYLPFSGNCRYIDLMGTHAYGLVMKDLNPELSKDVFVSDLLTDIIAEGGLGMENGKGFYKYKKGDAAIWDKIFRKFSYEIQEVIRKYPFNYKNGEPGVEDKKQSYF